MSLKQIALDVLHGKLVLSEAELTAERLKVCNECPSFKRMARQCEICGCFIDLKIRILNASCPIDKW